MLIYRGKVRGMLGKVVVFHQYFLDHSAISFLRKWMGTPVSYVANPERKRWVLSPGVIVE